MMSLKSRFLSESPSSKALGDACFSPIKLITFKFICHVLSLVFVVAFPPPPPALCPLRIFLMFGLKMIDNSHPGAIWFLSLMKLCWLCISWCSSVRSVLVSLPSEIWFSVVSSMFTISFSSFYICLSGFPIDLQSLSYVVHWGLFPFHLNWLLHCSMLRVHSAMV